MGIEGWGLFNVPERLSYSATPPDFGSLCIQRQRWATGGMLIVPKLWARAKACRRRGERMRFAEKFLRWNYMASITWSSISLLILLAFPSMPRSSLLCSGSWRCLFLGHGFGSPLLRL